MPNFTDTSGSHSLGETKVYNNLVTNITKLRRGAVYAFGATEYDLRLDILGEYAGTESTPLLPRADGAPHANAKYKHALDGGHRVIPLIHEVFGGMASDAAAYLSLAASAHML